MHFGFTEYEHLSESERKEICCMVGMKFKIRESLYSRIRNKKRP